MKIESLGHVVIKVRNQQRAEAFYHGLLGLPICARYDAMKMTFYSLGNHHDFATIATGDEVASAPPGAPGLFHVAFKIGDSLEALREAKGTLEAAGVKVVTADHDVTQSLYFADPDGNTVEVYVDTSDAWKRDPQRVAGAKPLAL